eukprot:TRINITY_DN15502_c0_g1_i2.p1 TRINITY_DN15502_c0_g1~~TRINITY_DN15502_c0_g1_i2.p1  ORF type:complete len:430 (+),score=83.61 TRINITY_DN15502_c0_g1_i2:50-1339(+)
MKTPNPADVGGDGTPDAINAEAEPHHLWEKEIRIMTETVYKGPWDRMRKEMESLDDAVYRTATYYERWALALIRILISDNVIEHKELLLALGYDSDIEKKTSSEPAFKPGDKVTVNSQFHLNTPWDRPHIRTPGYLFGKQGTIERICGDFPSPTLQALGISNTPSPLYRVTFHQKDIWPEYEGSSTDTIEAEIYESWLQVPGNESEPEQVPEPVKKSPHDYLKHSENENPRYLRVVEALKVTLLNKGLITSDGLRSDIEKSENIDEIPVHGIDMVAKAWTDPAYEELLLKSPKDAMAQFGIHSSGSTTSEHKAPLLIVVKNTDEVHNVVVCTLCSCYPTVLLGKPPSWYKSISYRSRVVRQPRQVLEEFGLRLPSTTSVKVHDSTADMRYLVLPMRPAGTEGYTLDQLKALITRDCLVGVTVPVIKGSQ